MWWYVLVWALAGVVLAEIGVAVSPPGQTPGAGRSALLGLLGGIGGGALVELLARRTVPGFTAGLFGSLVGSMLVLILWTIVAWPSERRA